MTFMVALGLTAQFRSNAGPDMGFLLDEAARVLDGARLYVDLVDMNPPLTVLLNIAAVLFARQFGLDEILAYRLSCAIALVAVLLFVAWLLRRLLAAEPALRRGILLTLTFTLFNLVGQDFGEREHLLLAWVLPYLLVAWGRASGGEIPRSGAIVAGVLAGSAFGLKPHFVLLWLAVEVYLRLGGRVAWKRVTPESAAIGAVLGVYALVTLLWLPGYLHLVRLLAVPYSKFLHQSFWYLLITGPGVLLTLFSLLTFAALRGRVRHRQLVGVFALGALACLVAGAAQQKGFPYHFYPSIALATTLLALVVCTDSRLPRSWIHSSYRVVAVSVLATVVVLAFAQNTGASMRLRRDAEQVQVQRFAAVIRARAAGEGVYVMSYHIGSGYPAINYGGAHSASRFAQLWPLAVAYLDQLRSDQPLRYHTPAEMSPSERYLNQAVLEDLRNQEPKLLTFLQHARDLPRNGFRRLNYVEYFGRDPRIAAIFGRYELVEEVGGQLVYQRVPRGARRTGPPPIVRDGTRDIVPGPLGGVPTRIFDPALQLAILAFLVSLILASFAEWGWGVMPLPRGSAEDQRSALSRGVRSGDVVQPD